MKQLIKDYISDLIIDFLYSDRKEDEDLQPGDIEGAISNGTITVDEIADHFRAELIKGINHDN